MATAAVTVLLVLLQPLRGYGLPDETASFTSTPAATRTRLLKQVGH